MLSSLAFFLIEFLFLISANEHISEDSCSNYNTCNGTVKSVNCKCDSKCVLYGDCCPDAPSYLDNSHLFEDIWTCHPYSFNRSLLVISKCRRDYNVLSTKIRCEMGGHISDPYSMMMVSNPRTNLTYKNVWCASCNDDSIVIPWVMDLYCNNTDIDTHYVYDKIEDAWGIEDYDNHTFHKCFFRYTIPEGLRERDFRKCNPFAIKKCPRLTDEVLDFKCTSFNSFIVDDKKHLFGNEHCAACNNVQNTQCVENKFSNSLGADPDDSNPGKLHCVQSLGVLLDIVSHDLSNDVNKRVTQRSTKTENCEKNEIYDFFFHKCRVVRCQHGYTIRGGKCRSKV